jgi:hypothetical protein
MDKAQNAGDSESYSPSSEFFFGWYLKQCKISYSSALDATFFTACSKKK